MLSARGFKIYWLVFAAVLVIVLLPFENCVSFALDGYGIELADMMLQESSPSPPVPTPPAVQQLLDPVFPELDVSFLPFRPPA
jgi:hypothetical protein